MVKEGRRELGARADAALGGDERLDRGPRPSFPQSEDVSKPTAQEISWKNSDILCLPDLEGALVPGGKKRRKVAHPVIEVTQHMLIRGQ